MKENLERYRIFYYAALCGNITAAAEKLYISQPAVSQSLKQLESSLGCALFLRTPKGVALTAEGKTLYRYVAKGMEQFTLGEKRLEAQLSLDCGVVYIGASDMTLEFFLLPFLERFHSLYPKIRVNVTNGPTPETLGKLENDIIDFGVVTEPFAVSGGVEVVPVREIEDIFICGGGFRGLTEDILTPEKLLRLPLPLIMLEKNTSTRRYIDDCFKRFGAEPAPEFELATSGLIVQFVKRDLGIGCVVSDFAENAIAEQSVYRIALDKPFPKRRMCIVKKASVNSKAAEKLLELLPK